MELAIAGALVTFTATTLGASPALFISSITEKTKDLFLGISAGVMLAATSFSLVQPSIALFFKQHSGEMSAFFGSFMILLGGVTMHLGNEHIPHEHFLGSGHYVKSQKFQIKQLWLFILALVIHNIPEGFAVGAAVGSGDIKISLPIMVGIGLQDISEGLVIALALKGLGYSTRDSFFVAVVTGLVEAAAAFIAFYTVFAAPKILPWSLAFSGGMMLYIISHEMIPESHKHGFEKNATAGLMIGFVVMMLLNNLLK